MALVSLPNTIANGDVMDADPVMENFDEIIDAINGGLNEANLPSYPEANVVFGNSGHGHTGGTDGKVLGATSYPVVVPLTDLSGLQARGAINAARGTTGSIAASGNAVISLAALGLSNVRQVLGVMVARYDAGTGAIDNFWEGGETFYLGGTNYYYGFRWSLTTAGLTIYNYDAATAYAYKYCIIYSAE